MKSFLVDIVRLVIIGVFFTSFWYTAFRIRTGSISWGSIT